MIYCIVGKDMEPLVENAFPEDDRIAIGDDRWLVRSPASTCMFVWERLVSRAPAIKGPPIGIVFAIHGYYGNADPTIWEWLAARDCPFCC